MRTLTFEEMRAYIESGKLNNVTNVRIKCEVLNCPKFVRLSPFYPIVEIGRGKKWRISHTKGRYIVIEFV